MKTTAEQLKEAKTIIVNNDHDEVFVVNIYSNHYKNGKWFYNGAWKYNNDEHCKVFNASLLGLEHFCNKDDVTNVVLLNN
jgi:hypothetical protein